MAQKKDFAEKLSRKPVEAFKNFPRFAAAHCSQNQETCKEQTSQMFVSQKSTKEQDQTKVVFFQKKVCTDLKIHFDIVVFLWWRPENQ